ARQMQNYSALLLHIEVKLSPRIVSHGMVLFIEIDINVVFPVEEIHTHRISSWLTIIGLHGFTEQCASQHLPPPKRLQLVPITGLNFRFLPAPKPGALVMT